jgi:hypothetical protein
MHKVLIGILFVALPVGASAQAVRTGSGWSPADPSEYQGT